MGSEDAAGRLDRGERAATSIVASAPGTWTLAVDQRLRRDRDEVTGRATEGLRASEHQETARRERVLEELDRLLLKVRIEVDEDVAAGHEVDSRVRRVARHVVRGEDAELANRLRDLVAAGRGSEEPRQPFRRDATERTQRVDRRARLPERLLVDVGPVDGDPGRAGLVVEKLEQGDGQRVDLLAGRAARHPDPHALPGAAVRHQRRKDGRLQRLEARRLAEERGHADEKILVQRLDRVVVLLEGVGVASQSGVVSEQDAPQDAPLEGCALEVAEVDRMARAQQFEDAAELRGVRLAGRFAVDRFGASGEADQLLADGRGPQHEIRRSGRGARHHLVLRAFRSLGERDASRVANRLKPERSIRVVAGEHHADRAVPAIPRQRAEETVQRTMRNLRGPGLQTEEAVLHRHLAIRRDHVDVVALDPHPVDHLQNGNRRDAGQDVDEQAVVARIEMLDQNEGEPRLGRNGGNQIDECVEAPGGGADPDDLHGGAGVPRGLGLGRAALVRARRCGGPSLVPVGGSWSSSRHRSASFRDPV